MAAWRTSSRSLRSTRSETPTQAIFAVESTRDAPMTHSASQPTRLAVGFSASRPATTVPIDWATMATASAISAATVTGPFRRRQSTCRLGSAGAAGTPEALPEVGTGGVERVAVINRSR